MDWIRLLEDYNISYVTRGPNTRRGEISIKCPWCGEDDPSEHLGIALSSDNWGCHRNQAHRGKAPYRLIGALLGCSGAQARLVVSQYDQADPETLDQALAALTGVKAKTMRSENSEVALRLPEEFRKIERGHTKRFWNYINDRGFDEPTSVAKYYKLRCATTGRWKDRVIIPVFSAHHELVAWTGRAIQNPINAPRYLSNSEDIKVYLFNEQKIKNGGNFLFITEGPFDAIKVDYYLMKLPHNSLVTSHATCTFGTSVSISQLGKLRSYTSKFRRILVLFDEAALEPSLRLADLIPGSIHMRLPRGVKDPGDLTKDQISNLIWNT